ncbi:MAG: hypothetical protein ACKO8W_12265 [Dolichospermum sp.]
MRYILSPLSKSGEGVGGGVTLYLITSVSAVISPITNYQLPITNYPLPITHYQLPIIHYSFSWVQLILYQPDFRPYP